jgi:hypothetical protein
LAQDGRIFPLTVPESHRARRSVIEVRPSGIPRDRKLLVGFEKTDAGYYASLGLASVIIAGRQVFPISK